MSAARPAALPDRLKDYVFVNERVSQFHERYPDGRIVTEMSVINETMVAFKALVFRSPEDAEPAATGHALDTIDVKQSSFEKTETASVGRALAFLNFSVKRSIASREEIEKQDRYKPTAGSEATARQPVAGSQPQPPAKPALPNQLDWIAGKVGDIAQACQKRFNLPVEQLDFETATKWIAELRATK